ncbi:uncharacterized protein LOC118192291 isoform X1 [Stegodyphus dumicola]|uniref:uncharacterized protein LOC118192291 isoform X1 n=2 Tax=Stegodyphus dumicola TaxID=202533 RepID=UPI0015AB7F51|nr:uncharacterized protein LOC118192291 isoform X1 [Stegodyphus dumicola]
MSRHVITALFVAVAFANLVYSALVENTHLVTMRKAEFMEIVDCISNSKDVVACGKFVECEKMMPKQVLAAFEKCQKECIAGGALKCSPHEPLYKSLEIPEKVFECIVENTHKLTPEENMKMVEFEKCSRELHIETCKLPKHHH